MKKRILKISGAAVLLIGGLILHHLELTIPTLIVCAAAYLLVGYRVLWKAGRNILSGKIFDENFLMTVATIGAFIVGEYPEAAAVMLFYQIGELFEHIAVGRSRRSVAELMQIRPDTANRKTENGIETVDPEEIEIGDVLVVSPGERVPLDGTVLKGSAQLDTSALTGESVPRTLREGDSIHSGCIVLDSVLEIRADKVFGESTVSKILELVENASSKKSRSEGFITRFAAWYTPVVVIIAVLLAVLPPLVLHKEWHDWIYRALNFLVVSCPCALVISVPLSFFGGIGGASRNGILIKGSTYLEALSGAKIAAFDKTGTLTEGDFRVSEVKSIDLSEEELLFYAAGAESRSSHPIALSLRKASVRLPEDGDIEDIKNYAGKGIGATVCGKKVLAGNALLLSDSGISVSVPKETGTVVYIAIDGKYAGHIIIRDNPKKDAEEAISLLHKNGIRTALLTGDRKETGEEIGKKLGLDEIYAELLPGDKVEKLEALMQKAPGKVVYVGDGLNDAPVLARADIGIAMGGLGSDAAIEAADVVIMTDEPSKIGKAISISRHTLRIVRQNILFALAVKVAVLVLSALGLTGLWLAVFADVGVCVLAILNALRALKK